jgi:hypothetical protein
MSVSFGLLLNDLVENTPAVDATRSGPVDVTQKIQDQAPDWTGTGVATLEGEENG